MSDMTSNSQGTFQIFELERKASSSIGTDDGKVGIGIGFVQENNEFVVKKLLPGSEASAKVDSYLSGFKNYDPRMTPLLKIQIRVGDVIKSVDGTGEQRDSKPCHSSERLCPSLQP